MPKFSIDDRVEYFMGDDWYEGVIKKINDDGNTYHILFDDGEVFNNAVEKEIKLLKKGTGSTMVPRNDAFSSEPVPRNPELKFVVGDRVEYFCGEGWYPGYVDKINSDNSTYCVKFDDGDYYDDATEKDMKLLRTESSVIASEGDKVNKSPLKASVVESDNFFGNEIYNAENPEIQKPDQQHVIVESSLPSQPLPNSPSVLHMISQVEHFLLPSHDERYWSIRGIDEVDIDINNSPQIRLENMLFQLTIADHIRLIQSLYRDHEDEQKLEYDLRIFGNSSIKLPMKMLLNRISEGRVRILALSRLCYSEISIEILRAIIDLANSYAAQGMWTQVAEHIENAGQLLIRLNSARKSVTHEVNLKRANHAAARVACIFRILREHATKNCGQIHHSFVKEITRALEKIDLNFQDKQQQPSGQGQNPKGSATSHPEYLGETIQFISLINDYFEKLEDENTMLANPVNLSWGDFVDYLRRDCIVVRSWMAEMNRVTLPQNKAALRVAFHLADVQKRGVVHPGIFSRYFYRFPVLAKVVSGSNLISVISNINVEVPIYVSKEGDDVRFHGDSASGGHRVDYELPITWEEVFALMLLECSTDTLSLLKIQIQTLSGVCNVFSNKLSQAELNMREALKSIEMCSLEMELPACELYNSIAQMMIMKHRQWHIKQKQRLKLEMEKNLSGEGGFELIVEEAKKIRRKVKEIGQLMTREDAEKKARSNLIKNGVKVLAERETDPTTPSLLAAYRYLVMSHQIVERIHGEIHPSVGAACLAVASVQNVAGELSDAREWLVKALRVMEQLNPVPVRAIAFVQVQLSQILSKQEYHREAMEVLREAALFHYSASMEAITNENKIEKAKVPQPLPVGHTGLEDVRTALSLMEKLLVMMNEHGIAEDSIAWSEKMAELAERAFGWYSKEVALCRKEVGLRCVKTEDWRRACINFKKSLEAHEMSYGEKDTKTLDICQLLLVATSHFNNMKLERLQQTEAGFI